MPLPLFALAAGASALYKGIKGAQQNRFANKIKVPEASYETSPYAAKILGEANMLKNARMPGAQNAEQNIMGNQANAYGNVERNATSGSQALAMLAGIQGNTNQAFNTLGQQEGNFSLSALGNWNQANQGMTYEHEKLFQDALRKRQEAIAQKNALRGAGTQNIGNAMNEATSLAYMSVSYTHLTLPTICSV